MVFILPLALLLVFAIVDFGLAFGRYQLLINAAHEGARVAAMNCRPSEAGSVVADARSAARESFYGLGVTGDDVTPIVTGACTTGEAEVSITYDHDFPIIANLSSLPGTLSLHYTAVRATEVPRH
jgi:Flp pilus assembly protein TadG